ncbi:sulfurtransferase [Motiliproteus coralliicola]|uniref:Sulfurtransferase n=1 Tax=Motiliproteus coralliicola TaxID=2283196 RepID=A0A369WTD7_9GAMM|nr:sulfurtransferase [Motiliproteus coralliicola]RDE25358.1 sulfurtransferase [Motiliproteus coralliicola]
MDNRTLIDAWSLKNELGNKDLVILDCRSQLLDPEAGEKLYREGHIPGAIHADMEKDLSSPITDDSGRHPLPDPFDFAVQLRQWGIDDGTQVVVYDDMNGAMAVRAWFLLRWLGHERVAVLDGGLPAWQAVSGELSDNEAQTTPVKGGPVVLHNDWLVDTAKVQANLDNPSFTLIDARAAERFAGEQEPIDPVAGHVPGALNRPLTDNLNAEGRFKTAKQLKDEWQQLLGEVEAEDTVMMCGSGVTACHHLLALEIAGLKGARLYPGSWSEWIRDPARPVATGS